MRYSKNEKINKAIMDLINDNRTYEIIEDISGKAMSMARKLEKYGVCIYFDNFKKSAVIIKNPKKKKKPEWRLI